MNAFSLNESALLFYRYIYLLLAVVPSNNCNYSLLKTFFLFQLSKIKISRFSYLSSLFTTFQNEQKFIGLVGTKLHRIVIKLAVETKNKSQSQRTELQQINLSDELFWFRRPRFLLRLIQFISFQVI